MIDILLILLLTTLTAVAFIANVLGTPGNWAVVLMAGGCLWFAPIENQSHVAWPAFIAILVVAAFGELLEFAAGALGASRMGGSKRGTVLAMLGSIGGAIAGMFFGSIIPIPILGPVIAALLLGASGAFGGAIAGERWAGKDWDQSLQIGSAAFWGRLLGTLGKAVCGTIACTLFLIAIWF
ncbi:MAG: DUF456 domain-containing protein [Pirellulaceae bacterium]